MKSGYCLFLVLALMLSTARIQASSAPELPVLYHFNSPLYDSGEWTVSVYQTGDFSVAVHTPADVSAVVQGEGKAAMLQSQGPAYAAGERTGHMLAKGQRLNRHYFRIEERQPLETGKRYSEMVDPAGPRGSPYQREWWIEDLSLNWERGDGDREINGLSTKHYVLTLSYDYHRVDHDDGERFDRNVESRREFWFADALPFSPLQMLPLRIINDYRYVCFCSPGGRRVNDFVDARLEDRLRSAGMLVRTRFEEGDETVTIEASGMRSEPALQLGRYRQWPVIPASRETPAVAALMLHEVLADAPAEGAGQAEVRLGSAQGDAALDLSGTSWFRVNPQGDFAVANIVATDDGAKGMLLLMRPYYGRPDPGSYSTRAQPEQEELEALDLESLKEQASHFQVVGLLERDDELIIYASTGEGDISITGSDGEHIEGEFSLGMDAIDTFGNGSIEQVVVEGQFGANEGLRARMRSRLGRLINRQE
ncbi:MAG: hypothetical protein RIC38_06655 [Chromatocurvus sp.]